MATNEKARELAAELLHIGAVKLSPETPFTWASGWKSPIYCDNRKTLSYPDLRDSIRNRFVATIRENYPDAQTIAGVATGGIAIGALVADALNLPFVYVRSGQKRHGLGNQIEGELPPKSRVVVIEDLISTGNSSLHSVHALRNASAHVLGMIAIFSYEFDVAAKNMATANCALSTLSGYSALLKEAGSRNFITSEQQKTLEDWRKDPENWKP